ncbi:MAG: hypothetical protein LBH42_08030, partial [Treponema sp.]|nr:hypothetical protein [Treponema sp.]
MIRKLQKKGKACYFGTIWPKTICFTYPALPFFYGPRKLSVFILLLAFFGIFTVEGEISPLPVIPRLDSRDTVFRQFLSDVEASRRVLFSSRQRDQETLASFLTIYSYTPRENEELMAIAARCNIPYGTLASINRFSHAEDMTGGRILLLPSMPGIFIPETPGTDLEKLLFSARVENSQGVVLSSPRNGKTERFRFIPGDDFSPTERVFFLDRGFRFPLRDFLVSSF